MQSPFPGMDPYLEARWSDVRLSLIVTLAESLQKVLPADLRARCEMQILPELPAEQMSFSDDPGPDIDRFVV